MNNKDSLKKQFLDKIQISPRQFAHNRLQTQNEELKMQNEKLKYINDQKDENLQSLKTELTKMQIQMDSEMEKKAKHLRLSNKDSIVLQEQNNELSNELTELRKTNQILRDQLTSMTSLLDSKSDTLISMQNKIDRFKQDADMTCKHFNTLKEEYTNLSNLFKQLEQENLTIKTNLDSKNNLYEQLNTEFQQLQQNLIKNRSLQITPATSDNKNESACCTDGTNSTDVFQERVLSRREMRLNKDRR